MADQKISALPLVTSVDPADEIIINKGGGTGATTSKVTLGTLLGGNEVSGIQYSSVFTSDLQVRKQENFNRDWQSISPGGVVDGYNITAPKLDWVSQDFTVPIPANADGAIFIMYTATAVIPTDNLAAHPNYISGSTQPAYIASKSKHRLTINGVTWQTNNVPDTVGWTDTHSIAMHLNDGVVGNNSAGAAKRSKFDSVNQITKLDFCTFTAGQTTLNINYAVDIYHAGYQYFEVRPVRLIVMPTQGISSASVAAAAAVDDDPFVPVSEEDFLIEIASMQAREIRHIMTMMDSYERIDSSVSANFDTFRTTLLGLSGSTDWAAAGAVIKSTKAAASALMNFDFNYGPTNPFGILS